MPAPLWLPCGGSTLDKYEVRLMNQALRDLDDIYAYIAGNLLEPGVAAEEVRFEMCSGQNVKRKTSKGTCIFPPKVLYSSQ